MQIELDLLELSNKKKQFEFLTFEHTVTLVLIISPICFILSSSKEKREKSWSEQTLIKSCSSAAKLSKVYYYILLFFWVKLIRSEILPQGICKNWHGFSSVSFLLFCENIWGRKEKNFHKMSSNFRFGLADISLSLLHTHTHTYTNTHIHTHTQIHTYTHTHTYTYTHIHIHTHTHTCTHIHTHTHTHNSSMKCLLQTKCERCVCVCAYTYYGLWKGKSSSKKRKIISGEPFQEATRMKNCCSFHLALGFFCQSVMMLK